MRRARPSLSTYILLVLAFYIAWQMHTLQRDVRMLKADMARMAKSESSSVKRSAEESLLSRACEHLDSAGKSISSGRPESAKAELEKGLQLVRGAIPESSEKLSDATDSARNKVQSTQAVVQRIWQQILGKPTQAKGG